MKFKITNLLNVFLMLSMIIMLSCSQKEKNSQNYSEIDKEQIRLSIRDNRKAFLACYDQALKANSNISGKVVMKWDLVKKESSKEDSIKSHNEIYADIKNIEVKSSDINDTNFKNCMMTAISSCRFSNDLKEGQTYRIVYPFVFSNQSRFLEE